jgi:uncharacterized protein with FMN-binding domain
MKKALVIIVAVALLGTVATYLGPSTKKTTARVSITAQATSVSSGSGQSQNTSSNSASTPASTNSSASSSGGYKDGTYHGQDYSSNYGDLAVSVVIKNGKITTVNFDQLNPSSGHSQEIDNYATPILVSQTLSVQSSSIDGVSGASFTTSAYEQSLQSALDQAKA